MPLSDAVLLIDRGDLASLAALANVEMPDRAVLWHPRETDPAAGRRRAVAHDHTRIFGVRRLVEVPAPAPGLPGMAPPPHLHEAAVLLGAVAAAVQLDIERIVWPATADGDDTRIADLVDRALSVAALAASRRGAMPPEVDLPLVELTLPEIVEVADDAGAPMRAFWPCERDGDAPCETCAACRTHRAAFERRGLPWPWAVVDAGA